jgi:hypothetical protein
LNRNLSSLFIEEKMFLYNLYFFAPGALTTHYFCFKMQGRDSVELRKGLKNGNVRA